MNETTPSIEPTRSILLVMDYQVGIINQIPGAEELVGRVAETIVLAREHGMQVGYVRVAFTDTDHESIPEHNVSFKERAKGGSMHADAPHTQIHEAIAPQPGDIVVRKTRVGPFTTTDLEQQLHKRGLTTLVLAGLSTSGVVLSTVREAVDRDFQVYVLEDITSDSDRAVHDMLTQKVFPRQAHIITSQDLPKLIAVA